MTLQPLIGLTGRHSSGQVLGMPAGFSDATVDAYLSEYATAVARAGGVPVHLPLVAGNATALAERLDGLLLSGGADVGDQPDRDQIEFDLIEAFRAAGKPILGICRGAQILNVACGGSLVQDLPLGTGADHADLSHPRAFRRHRVVTEPGTLAARLYGAEVWVNSFHHQAVDQPGDGVNLCAQADDGVVEAIEGAGFLGVQWHPEALDQDPSFKWLCETAVHPVVASDTIC